MVTAGASPPPNRRVLHVLNASIPMIFGYTTRSRSIVLAQRALGWHPVVVTSARHDNTSGSAIDTIDGITYYRTLKPEAPKEHLLQEAYFLSQRIVEVARREKPEVIHAHSPVLMAGPAWLAARRLGLGCVYEIRSLWEEGPVEQGLVTERSLRYRLSRRAETTVAKRVDAVVCISEGLRRDFASRGLAERRLSVVPNGVDAARFTARPPDEATRASLGLAGKTVVGYVGTFFDFEGVVDLVEALARLMKQGRGDLMGLIVGAGVGYEACRAAAARHGLSDRILHPGRVPMDEVEKLYSVMDVLAYPRRSIRVTELVTPLKPLEAMAMEKAVIVSDVGGHKELVTHGETGLVFRSGNVDDLATAIVELADNPALRRLLGQHARERVVKERGWVDIVRRYGPVYDAVIGARQPYFAAD